MNVKKEQFCNTCEYNIYDGNKFILSILGTDDIYDMSNKTFEIFYAFNRISCIANVSHVESI